MKYSIVIPTYNHCDDLLAPCIRSIIKYSTLEDIEIIISANGCTDNTFEYLRFLQTDFDNLNLEDHLKIIWSDEPLGYPKATNLGIEKATGDYIILLNNDAWLLEQTTDNWLERLRAPFDTDSSVGITGVNKIYSDVIKMDFIIFFCAMIKRELFQKIGMLDEDFNIGAGEDTLFCYKAVLAGYKLVKVDDDYYSNEAGMFVGTFPLFHPGEKTMHDTELVPNWNSVFENNHKLLQAKVERLEKFSIIVPVYNAEKTIRRTLNAILRQLYINFHIIIVNDGSTDNTDAICLEYANFYKDRITYISHESNLGVSEARNTALRLVNTKYIAFCDADDVWGARHLLLCHENLLHYDMVYTKPILKFEDGSDAESFGIEQYNEFKPDKLFFHNYIYISGVAFHTAVYRKIGEFDSRVNSIEDWDYWRRVFCERFKIKQNNELDFIYTIRNNSMAGESNQEKINIVRNKTPLKINLGCGKDYQPGYINCDYYVPGADWVISIDDLSELPNDSVDVLLSSHTLEHFTFSQSWKVLAEWYRVLKPGGKLIIETPDFLASCKEFVYNPNMRTMLYGHFFAFPDEPGNVHYFLYTEEQLGWQLQETKFKDIIRVEPCSNYVNPETKHLFLRMECTK